MPCASFWPSGANLESTKRWRYVASRNLNHVDKYVLDNGQGGTGQRFDWSLLNGEVLDNVLLAGGLSPDNCRSG
jgi:phosphoribosylanthranilate isomerase